MQGDNMFKKEILAEIDNLPDAKIPEVLDFIKFLSFQHRISKNKSSVKKGLFSENPMDKFIGGVEHGSLAKGIDKELYE